MNVSVLRAAPHGPVTDSVHTAAARIGNGRTLDGMGFGAALRLSGVILSGPPVIPAAFGYLYRQGGGR